MNLPPSSQNLASCTGSQYGSNASLSSRSSGYTTPQLRDVLAVQLQNAQRMTGSPLPMDAQPSYSGGSQSALQSDRAMKILTELHKELKVLNGRVGQLERNNQPQ